MTTREDIERALEAATPGPWVRGTWSGQSESKCSCSVRKGKLLAKVPQTDYPGAGPYHVHETDFWPDEHEISSAEPMGGLVAGNYDYDAGGIVEDADAHLIANAPTWLRWQQERIAELEAALRTLLDNPCCPRRTGGPTVTDPRLEQALADSGIGDMPLDMDANAIAATPAGASLLADAAVGRATKDGWTVEYDPDTSLDQWRWYVAKDYDDHNIPKYEGNGPTLEAAIAAAIGDNP